MLLNIQSQNETKRNNSAIQITTDSEGGIYTCFFEMPLVRKYSKEGALLWEKDLRDLEIIDKAYENILEQKKENPNAMHGLFGGITYDMGKIYISALGSDDGSIFRKVILKLDSKSGAIEKEYRMTTPN